MIDMRHGWNVSVKPVILGFIFSAIVLLAAYRFETHYHMSSGWFTFTVITLAIAQAVLQLMFFMHLGLEEKPRWNAMMLGFMAFLIFVLVGGTLWIMANLNYNVMPEM